MPGSSGWLPGLGNSRDRKAGLSVALAAICFGLIIGLTSFHYAAALMIMIVVAAAFILQPRLALYGTLILSPYFYVLSNYYSTAQLGMSSLGFSIIDILIFAATAGVAFKILATKEFPSLTAVDFVCLAWLGMSLVGLGYGLLSGYGAAFRSARGPLMFVLYFVAVHEINSRQRLHEVKNLLLLTSPLIGITGILGSTGYLTAYFPKLTVGLVGGILTRPNFFAEPALAIPNIIFLIVVFKYLRPKSLIGKAVLLIGLILNCALLMLSVTRGFWLGLIAAFMTLLFLLYKERKIRLSGIFSVVVMVLAAIFLIQWAASGLLHVNLINASFDRVLMLFTGGDPNSAGYRIDEFMAYLGMFIKSPAFGMGFGSPVLIGFQISDGFAHDEYIWILETVGLLGFTLVGSFFVLLFRHAMQNIKARLQIGIMEVFEFTFLAVVIGYAVVSITSPEMTNPATVPALAVLAAAVRNRDLINSGPE